MIVRLGWGNVPHLSVKTIIVFLETKHNVVYENSNTLSAVLDRMIVDNFQPLDAIILTITYTARKHITLHLFYKYYCTY